MLGATSVSILETFKNFFLSLTGATFLLHVCQLFLVFALAYSQQEEPSDAVFKVPVLPPPKTPEVILLEDFSSHVTRKKSCNTLLSNSGDITELNNGTMDQSADLFANIDDCHSPGKEKYFTLVAFHSSKHAGNLGATFHTLPSVTVFSCATVNIHP